MLHRMGEYCAFLDRSVPEVRGDHVHFTAYSGGSEMLVCMSRHEARRMAHAVIRELDASESAAVVDFRASG